MDENTPDLFEESKGVYQSGNLEIYLLKCRQLKHKREQDELAKMKIDML